jgi:hypothetical protein
MRAIKGKRARFLKLFVPSLVDSMAMAGLRDDVKPR